MKTSAINNPLATTGNTTSAKASAPSDMPFDQVLSREVSNRSNASELSAPKTRDSKAAAQTQQNDQAATTSSKSNETPTADEGKTVSAAEDTATTVSESKVASDTAEVREDEETTLDAATAELLALVTSLNLPVAVQAKTNDGHIGVADEVTKDIVTDVKPEAPQVDVAATAELAATAMAATTLVASEAAPTAAITTPQSTSVDPGENTLPAIDVPRIADIVPGSAKRGVHTANLQSRTAASPASRISTQGESSDIDTQAQTKGEAAASVPDSGQIPESGAAKPQPAQIDFAAAASDLRTATKAHEPQSGAPINIAALSVAQPQNPAQAAAAAATNNLTPRVGNPGWDQALGQKVVWMVSNAQQSASLTLNPPDLGPLQVVLNVTNSHATANFTAAQPEVRQALENAMPKLREMLGDAGIQLGQTNVSAGTPNNQQGTFSQRDPNRQTSRGNQTDDVPDTPVRVSTSQVVTGGRGLVDTFV